MQAADRRAIVTPHLVLGILALVAGVLLLAGNLGFAPASELLRYWPAALIAIGGIKLVRSHGIGGAIGGAIWLGAGAWLLLYRLGLLHVSLWEAAATYWPVLLVLLGLTIVRQTLARRRDGDRAIDRRDELHVVAILGIGFRQRTSKEARAACDHNPHALVLIEPDI